MFNSYPSLTRYDLRYSRFHKNRTLFFRRENTTYVLTEWPELASFRSAEGSEDHWVPDFMAGNYTFDACQISFVKYYVWKGCLCEFNTDQVLIPSVLCTGNKLSNYFEANDQIASRIHEQWLQFSSSIPAEIKLVVQEFRCNRLSLYRMLSECPEALTLAKENPSVFFELGCHFYHRQSKGNNRQEVLRLLRGPQRAILALRGLPASESARRFFRKLPPDHISSYYLKVLGRALMDKRLGRWLTHITPLSSHIALLLVDYTKWKYLTPQLVHELAKVGKHLDNKIEKWISVNSSVINLVHQLKRYDRRIRLGRIPLQRFRSSNELRGLLDLPKSFGGNGPVLLDRPFPCPPVPGTLAIIPIISSEELIIEATIQKNCASLDTYPQKIIDGTTYFYKVIGTNGLERCTARIEQSANFKCDKQWVITELRAYDNAIPSRLTVQAVVDSLGLPAQLEWHPNDAVFCINQNYAFAPKIQEITSSIRASYRVSVAQTHHDTTEYAL